ncbi:MAG: DNA integrity scanning diadenylate cyclase DisA [Candidatus Nanoarchaeia archaeon]|nr:DNA integrity scanning diadenylate cyclase DisA [Candidatus Nanoarchaeia archaeon]MDD5587751.1 DNA integrity scanning diadenylate cyclase DisA [Candidatus Nanoarchaeia archaeon]
MEKKEILAHFSYGSAIRNAIEKITNANRGVLVVFVKDKGIKKISVGGFKINEEFSEERLAELAKLDGAILVDNKLQKIISANVLLNPSIKIPSTETGTRHQAAERTARQLDTMVLAISAKTGTAMVYHGNGKLKLNNLGKIFTKTGEALRIIEKHRELFKVLIKKFDTFELLEMVTLEDLASIFQREKIMDSVADIISVYLSELGDEGELTELQLKEIITYVHAELAAIMADYHDYFNFDKIIEELKDLKRDEIVVKENIFKIFLDNRKKEDTLIPKGYRILKNIPILTEENIKLLMETFPSLKELISAQEEELAAIKSIGNKKAKAIREYLLKAQI